jgi:hypothetical protein
MLKYLKQIEVNTPNTNFNLHRGQFTWCTTGLNFGTLLFLIYINDLLLSIQGAKVILYADDTNVLVIVRNEEALQIKLSSVMKQLENWFLKN